MSARSKIFLLSGSLILLGIGLTLYKVWALGFPLFPGEIREVWTIESKIHFSPGDGAIDVELKIERCDAGRIMTASKVRDGEDGAQFAFDLEGVAIGISTKGRTVASCVAVPANLVCGL